MSGNLFHFLRPWWWLALLPLAYLLCRLVKQQHQAGAWAAVCDPILLPHLLEQQTGSRGLWPVYLGALAGVLSIFALAGPTWSFTAEPTYSIQNARVLAFDLSPAMLATDITPSRLVRARYKALDILAHSEEGQIGMVAFASEAYTVSPLTEDERTIALMIPDLTPAIMPVTGDNITAALEKSAELLQQEQAQQGQIILITAAAPTPQDIETAKKLQQQGLKISVLGVGTVIGAPIPTAQGYVQNSQGQVLLAKLDEAGLAQLAAAGGGNYRTVSNDDKDVEALLASSVKKKTKKSEENATIWKDEGSWFVWLLLPLVLLGFRRGWLERLLP